MTYYLYEFNKSKLYVYECYIEAPNRMDADRQARDVVAELESKQGPTIEFVLVQRDTPPPAKWQKINMHRMPRFYP